MKKIIVSIVLLLGLSTAANASWQCKANVNGTNFGWNGYVYMSNQSARISAIETCNFESGMACYIQNCWELW